MPISLVISRGKNGGGGGSRDESRRGEPRNESQYESRGEGRNFMRSGGYSPEDTMRFVDDEGRNEPRQLGYLRAHEGGGRQDETVEHLKHEIKRLSEQLERIGQGWFQTRQRT